MMSATRTFDHHQQEDPTPQNYNLLHRSFSRGECLRIRTQCPTKCPTLVRLYVSKVFPKRNYVKKTYGLRVRVIKCPAPHKIISFIDTSI